MRCMWEVGVFGDVDASATAVNTAMGPTGLVREARSANETDLSSTSACPFCLFIPLGGGIGGILRHGFALAIFGARLLAIVFNRESVLSPLGPYFHPARVEWPELLG
uniref:Uncharacterized protein n=1 Tax=Plectus sambesii TaxID=2011161 RepID=A0A914V954_9BILA